MTLPVSAERAFAPVERIGGRTGWYYAGWLWSLRGAIDLVLGGPGMRRRRPRGRSLRAGDARDFRGMLRELGRRAREESPA